MSDKCKIIQTAILCDENVSTGNTKHVAYGKEVEKPYRLIIAQYEGVEGFYLLYLDKNGQELTDTFHNSIESAYKQAKFELNLLEHQWVKNN